MVNWKTCPGRIKVPMCRREMLTASANGFGLLALSALLADQAYGASQPRVNTPGSPNLPRPHFTPRAKNVIFCFMDGGVSHVDSFDPKPELDRRDGQTYRGNRNWFWKIDCPGNIRRAIGWITEGSITEFAGRICAPPPDHAPAIQGKTMVRPRSDGSGDRRARLLMQLREQRCISHGCDS